MTISPAGHGQVTQPRKTMLPDQVITPAELSIIQLITASELIKVVRDMF